MSDAGAHAAPESLVGMAGWTTRVLRRAALSRLDQLVGGEVTVVEGRAATSVGARGPLDAVLEVQDSRFWWSVALRGSVGAGESFERGEWTSPDLAGLMSLFARNRVALARLDAGLAVVARPALRLFQALHPNTRQGSRENIAAHYDLGNDFFAAVLDPSLTYSCALFEHEGQPLEQAQEAKIERACQRLGLSAEHHLLEIGTGWGALALHAAREHGCRVTTTTLSKAQAEVAIRRVQEAGLSHRVTVLLRDYRDLEGRFDAVVSIEMIEAIGAAQLPVFFKTVRRLLVDDGALLLQAITMADDTYETARREVDWVRRYIFPGSCIPSLTALTAAATAGSDLRLVHLESLTPHYATTLRHWRQNLLAARRELVERGYEERLLRRFEYYFALCEGGFAERYLGDVQALFDAPLRRTAPGLPLQGT